MEMHHRVTVCLIIFVIEVTTRPTCRQNEYMIGEKCCPMCPVGSRVDKHCTEFRSTTCLLCDNGTYMDEPTARTECFHCRTCDSGSGLRVKVPCSSWSDTVCEPEDRFFCVKSSDEGNCEATQKHSLCSPGEFIQQPGSSSADTVCSPCPQGSFSGGTLSSCQPHTRCEKDKVTVKEGTSQSDAKFAEISSVRLGAVISVSLFVLCLILSLALLLYKKIRQGQEQGQVQDLNLIRFEPLQEVQTNGLTNGFSVASVNSSILATPAEVMEHVEHTFSL
ncbi:tumor necrosis factor receptor superfamily member 14-like isoform X1 [Boleophthalmus pectinirostris]|uniref:tumor necrosis factor receptor superfamily member 14-like isoform X1 n=1 Tax=Boleophthalmus pectinirostris TaxID=150288 RepID=UPI00242A8B5B|nr:tumor necrosis factor receptor superfamily member 14-like isoform X1 [Boleophthalmus pectinirostris]XP_055021566.1 tumor necrosis factor receptor superfamily member 14-like isoform X1 [Boleophthalmus pectinirostris]XP_055021567.1 tumor necrosis factor receptor superfamily member 14-like isoform X1 [Boleophthalmus pectinirostris]